MTIPDPQASLASPALELSLPPAGRLRYWPDWICAERTQELFSALHSDPGWRQLPVRLFGRDIPQPRLTAFHADGGINYTYSGLCLQGRGWSPTLALLRDRLNAQLAQNFNSVLCNLYRDGRDYMGWHADDERELGAAPVIASLSFGARRRFQFRPRHADHGHRQELMLDPGSLLVMSGDLQHHWQHQLPKSLRITSPRINLTFRRIG